MQNIVFQLNFLLATKTKNQKPKNQKQPTHKTQEKQSRRN